MAAAKLVTRCPACRTAFRIVADQLRLRQGLVRCGQCDTVFDAREHLVEVPPVEPPVDISAPVTVEAALAHAEQTRANARTHAAEKPFDPGFDPGYDVPALDSPTMMMAESEALPGPDEGSEADTVAVPEDVLKSEGLPLALVATPEPEPTEPSLPPEPWPTLDHSAFGDTEPPPRGRSKSAPAAASGIPASGAYSAKPPSSPLPPSPASPAWPSLAADGKAGTETDAEAAADPVRSASEFLRAETADPSLTPEPFDNTPDSVTRENTTRHWLRRDGEPSRGFAPDFLRHTRGPQRQREHKVALPGSKRGVARAAVVILAVGALLEGTYLARSQLAGGVPALRPLLEAACAPLHCEVPPWRDLEALRIDSSQLLKQDEGSDVYQLAVTMRNQGRATTALPAIELVMTDLQDQLLLRRVLQPAEYLEPAQRTFATSGLRAGTELPVRVRFRTQQTAANYRVLIFYP